MRDDSAKPEGSVRSEGEVGGEKPGLHDVWDDALILEDQVISELEHVESFADKMVRLRGEKAPHAA